MNRLNSNIMNNKLKSLCIIYADSESILVTEENGKQNPGETHTNKYQKCIACRYGCKLVYIDNKFSKLCQTYVGEDGVYTFTNSIIEES